ncbi:hypothetical protein KL86CLO1_13381 [uncultured Eubacteriales bacterium]|uniref:Uncharacterized protein n=1 Tax=uncultured Eubacteriales bacterium TaxID=172733 RepID=A0A212KJD4_9FIRM|nr:hypothetical protein KL86CLO1_13381 [uncultured Eubacteriales bacterium]
MPFSFSETVSENGMRYKPVYIQNELKAKLLIHGPVRKGISFTKKKVCLFSYGKTCYY